MRSYHITIDYCQNVELLEVFDSAPKRSFTATGVVGNHGFFRIDAAIEGPQSEQPKHDFSLTGSESEDIRQAVSNLVKTLEEKLR